jgi:hypothetical protein
VVGQGNLIHGVSESQQSGRPIPPVLRAAIEEMRRVEPTEEYYAVTLLATETGRIQWSVQTHFVGFAETRPQRELRIASLVHGDTMWDLWESIGEPAWVVHTATQLALYLRFGGNGLIERNVAEQHLVSFIPVLPTPAPTGRDHWIGQSFLGGAPAGALRHRPTRTQRMRILLRDKERCRICGRSPEDNEDLELHVHHIAAWGRGGLTVDDNLITLCDTCHDGLPPYELPELWERANPQRGLIPKYDYNAGVRRYRDAIRNLLSAVGPKPFVNDRQ